MLITAGSLVGGILGLQPISLAPTRDICVSTARTQIRAFKNGLSAYAEDNGHLPTTSQGLRALVERPSLPPLPRHWDGPYLSDVTEIPKDPWGNDYYYLGPSSGGQPYVIISFGEDGRPGGTGYAADLISTDVSD